MNGWSLEDYYRTPAEYRPVLHKLVEEHNREIQRAAEKRR